MAQIREVCESVLNDEVDADDCQKAITDLKAEIEMCDQPGKATQKAEMQALLDKMEAHVAAKEASPATAAEESAAAPAEEEATPVTS